MKPEKDAHCKGAWWSIWPNGLRCSKCGVYKNETK